MTNYGPCETWPVIWSCDVATLTPVVTGYAVEAATAVMWALTGRQFGTCQVTLRPCRADCYDAPWPSGWSEWPGSGSWPRPALIGGQWFNLTCGACPGSCSCTALSEVLLPAPVLTVDVVRVDGSPLVTSAYRLDDARRLVRLDGGVWPYCNDLLLADTEVGTWSVTATYGQVVPVLGQLAVGELACEFVRAIGGEACRLPRNVQTLVRQGVTINFPDVLEMLKEGFVGLYLGDMFIATYNPGGLRRRAKTYNVDVPRHRRVAT